MKKNQNIKPVPRDSCVSQYTDILYLTGLSNDEIHKPNCGYFFDILPQFGSLLRDYKMYTIWRK